MRNIPFYIIIFILLFLLLRQGCNSRNNLLKTKRNFQTVVSGLQQQVTKDGVLIHKISSLSDKRKESIKLLEMANDSLSNKLAKVIKESGKGTKAAVVLDIKTVYIDTGSIVRIIDSAQCKGDTLVMWPTYQSGGHDNWSTWAVTAGPDTIVNRFTVYNQFALAWKKKKGRIEVKIHNANPYTTTVGSKAWVIEQRPVFWTDYGIEAVGSATAVNNAVGFGLYGDLKYRRFTGSISGGIQNTNEGILTPYGRIQVKAAIGRFSY